MPRLQALKDRVSVNDIQFCFSTFELSAVVLFSSLWQSFANRSSVKKHGILNPHLAKVLAELGHTDLLVIADAGLPLPLGIERVDLSLVEGVPRFLQVLEAVLLEVDVEAITLASEIMLKSPNENARIRGLFTLEPTYVSHVDFKSITHRARAIVRTGECTPYCNIILQAGVHDGFKR